MPFGIDDAIAIGGGLSAIFGGGDKTKNQVKEQKREFDIGTTPAIARALETSGLRDKLLAIFGTSAGAVPQRFQARDMFNPDRSRGPAPNAPIQGQPFQPPAGPPPGFTPPPGTIQLGDAAHFRPTQPSTGPGIPQVYGQAPQRGGVDPQTLALPEGYKMGDGGVDVNVYQDLLRRLGYGAHRQAPQRGQYSGLTNGPGYMPWWGGPINNNPWQQPNLPARPGGR